MATFKITKDNEGKYRYLLVADNGEPILRDSEGHSYKSACETSIASVKVNAPHTWRYTKHDLLFNYSFTLKGGNGEPIGVSETYTTSYDRDRGIDAVMRNAPNATTTDLTASLSDILGTHRAKMPWER